MPLPLGTGLATLPGMSAQGGGQGQMPSTLMTPQAGVFLASPGRAVDNSVASSDSYDHG